MDIRCGRDLMRPLDDYAAVPGDGTLRDAVRILKEDRVRLLSGGHPPRAVLVVDSERRVIGQMGHLDFLSALEHQYRLLGDPDTLSRAGVSAELVDSSTDYLGFWQGSLPDICKRARSIKVTDLMHPITESISEDAPLSEAIHKIVMWQGMRILVTRGSEVIGVLRLADLFC